MDPELTKLPYPDGGPSDITASNRIHVVVEISPVKSEETYVVSALPL